jgi:hypothetical protein
MRDGRHWTMTLGGFQLVDPTAPVAHVSYFEADAFAAWSGKRLHSEAEWEVATQRLDVEGNFLDLNRLRPKPASPRKAGVQQMFGASNDSRRRFRSRASISGELPVGSGISSARVGQEWRAGNEIEHPHPLHALADDVVRVVGSGEIADDVRDCTHAV